jgi:uncharacterized protein YecT (DUF1311 family)
MAAMIRVQKVTRHAALLLLAVTLAIVGVILSTGFASAEVTITERRLERRASVFEVRVAYPQIGIAAADTEMAEWVQSLIDEFQASLAERTEHQPPYFLDLSYTVVRNDDSVVSVLFSYGLYTGGAHPTGGRQTFTYLLPDGARVFLPDLLGGTGVERVSQLAITDLTTRLLGPNGMSDPDWIRAGAGPYADNFERFEWLEDEVVLHFDAYAVAAYAAGPQEVHIPLAKLQDVLRPDPRAPLPSFDCAQARTPIERAICSDTPLAQLDRRTAEAVATRVRLEARLGAETPTVDAQQAWLAQRDAACADQGDAPLVTCLKLAYASRLKALRSRE